MKSYLKTVLATTLCYLIVLSVFPLSLFSAFAVEITLDGDGTQASPYLIKNAEEFVYAMGEYANDDEVYMSLENEIDVSDVYSPVSSFKAHFNGNNHIITANSKMVGSNQGSINSLVYYNNNTSQSENAGLCAGNSGKITNSIVHANIDGWSMSAGIICSSNSGKIFNCAAFGKLHVNNEAGCKASGIAVANSGTIANCYVAASVKATGKSCYGTSHDHPISLGDYENSYYNSDMCKGYNSNGCTTVFMHSQNFVDLLNKDIKTKDSMWMLDSDNKNQGYPVITSAYNPSITSSKKNYLINGTEQVALQTDDDATIYYTLDGSEPNEYSQLYTEPIEISDSVTIKAIGFKNGVTGRSVKFCYVKMKGDGTEESPYLIDSETAFKAIPELSLSAFYEITRDIEFLEGFSSIECFYGSLEGNNHTIRGVLSSTLQNGLFKKNYGLIQNLNIDNENEVFKSNGAFAYLNYGLINHCSYNGTVIGYTFEGGGFNQISYKTQKCTGLGGFVSMNYGAICDSVFTGELRADEGNTVGGFAGVNCGKINNCLFEGNVFMDDNYFDSSSYSGNYFYNYLAGFVGINSSSGSIELSTANTEVVYAISKSYSPTCVYTFCGNMDSSIENCSCSNGQASIGSTYLEYGENLVVTQVLDGIGYTNPSHIHNYKICINEPTCTETGSATYTCKDCGDEIQSQTFEALGHNYVYVDVPSTYEEQGYKGYVCNRCGNENGITYRDKLQIISGSCGESCTYWMDTGIGTLKISGSGEMTDYFNTNEVPWSTYKEYIKVLDFDDEITSVGNNAFTYCDNLTEINLPNVLRIGSNAFYSCANLRTVSVDGVKQIKENAFKECKSLKNLSMLSVETIGANAFYINGSGSILNLTLPDTLQSVGTSAFYGMHSLKNVYYLGTVDDWTQISFSDFTSTPMVYASRLIINGEEIEEAVLTTKITEIKPYAFYRVQSLKKLVLPNTVTLIGNYSFSNCRKLEFVDLPDSLQKIGSDAFYYCYSIKELKLPCSVTVPSETPFANCTGIEKLTLTKGSGTMPDYTAKSKPWKDSKSVLKELVVENGVGNIIDNAFSGYSNLEFVTLPENTSIGVNAFKGTKYYKTLFDDNGLLISGNVLLDGEFAEGVVEIPDTVTEISSGAFSGNSKMTSLVIPDSVTTVGENAFSNCRGLNSLSVPCSLDIYDENSFSGCTTLTSLKMTKGTGTMVNFSNSKYTYTPWYRSKSSFNTLILEEGIESIGAYAFRDLTALSSISINNGLKRVSAYSFYGDSSITSIILPDTLESVGVFAFYNCSGLKELTFPCSANLSNNLNTFANCTNIDKITMTKGSGEMPSYSENYRCTPWYISRANLKEFVLEEGIENIGAYMFYGNSSFTGFDIPDSVTHIDSCAFSNCKNLLSILLPKQLKTIGSNAFSSCSNLTEIVIPDSVETINSYAFQNCSKLQSINIPAKVKEIKTYTFAGCNKLSKITLGENIEAIGMNAFSSCASLKKLFIINNNCTIDDNSNTIYRTTVIVGYPNSTAQEFAKANSRTFQEIIGQCPECGSYDLSREIIDASCTAGGYHEFTCADCGHKFTDNHSNPLGHTTVIDEAVAPSCTQTGLTAGSHCSVCGEVFVAQETIPATGHTVVKDDAVAPTCTKTGLTEGSHCSVCGEIIKAQEIIHATGHTPVKDEAKAPTCTETGLTEGSHCSVCGEILKAQEVVPAKGHTVVKDDAVAPTCTKKGLNEGSHCSDCGEILVSQTVIDVLGHKIAIDDAVAATCTETGLTSGAHCSVCGEILVAQEIVPAKGHTVAIDEAKPATCTETGLTEGSHCSVCHEVIKAQKVIPALGHTIVIDEGKPATCTETGLTEGSHCSVCHEVLKEQKVIPALGHTVVIDEGKPATCTETGLTEGSHCSVCHEVLKEQEVIPAKGHTVVIDEAKPATCTETGLTEGSHCSACHEVLKAQEVIPAKDHKWDEGKVTKEPTCTEDGVKTFTCENCKETKTEKIDALGHTVVIDKAKPATCTETGLTEGSHCSVCHEVIKAQEVIPETGHKWDEGKVTKEPTCTEDGVKTFKCENCHETKTESIEAKGHSWDEGVVTKEPTYKEEGEKLYTCSDCGETKTEKIPTLEKRGKFVVSNETVRAGDDVQVKIYIDKNPGITALSINVDFPEELTLKEIKYTNLLSSKPSNSKDLSSPFTISWLSPSSEDEDDTGLFATLTFTPNINAEVGDYTVRLTYKTDNIVDSTVDSIPFDVQNGTVSVQKPTPGDVNRDGAINMKDLVLIQQLINNWDIHIVERAADVNDDGDINMKDLVILQQYINGWEVALK